YNERVENTVNHDENKVTGVLVGRGRSLEEQSVIYIENGDYKGFGYFNSSHQPSFDELVDLIQPYKNNNDVKRILNGFFGKPLPKQYSFIKTSEIKGTSTASQ
ncbi:MAG: hypothetical protein KJP21_09770, partial [Bacteroidia bacterium]|nr:hypothetical protein [Bacteroidia bacterium]